VQSTNEVTSWGTPEWKNQVNCLEWVTPEATEIIAGYQNGDVKIWDLTGNVVSAVRCPSAVVGVRMIDDEKILICMENGDIAVTQCQAPENFIQHNPTDRKTVVRSLYNSQHQEVILLGGQKVLTQVHDINTGKMIWKARNLPNDYLSLAIPIWDRDADWVDESKRVFVTVTAYSEIRIYDIRAGARPISNNTFKHKEGFSTRPFTSVRVHPKNNTLIAVANTFADLQLLDLRRKCDNRGRFKGIAGSIRNIVFHPSGDYLIGVGLDRFFHIYELKKRKPLNKTYIKLRLNRVLISPHDIEKPDEKKEGEETENVFIDDEEHSSIEDSEDTFEELEPVIDTSTPKTKPQTSKNPSIPKEDETSKRKLETADPQKNTKRKTSTNTRT